MDVVSDSRRLIDAGRRTEALALINNACAKGDATALQEKAIWHLVGDLVPRDLAAARHLLSRATNAGHEAAGLLEVALTANGTGAEPDFTSAFRLLRTLASRSAIAASHLALLDAMQLDEDGMPAGLPPAEILHDEPRLVLYRGLLSEGEQDHLIAASTQFLEPALVADPGTGRMVPHPIRTSKGALLGPTREDLVIRALNLRLARASGTDIRQGEALTVLRYAPGEQYRLHMDTLPSTTNQRSRTVLVYLNSGFRGGETFFPAIDMHVTPRAGDALIFDNLDRNGLPDPRACHAGVPVTDGVKWLATRWIRRHPFDVWRGPEVS
jgi:prolyl 4-hydroxylase